MKNMIIFMAMVIGLLSCANAAKIKSDTLKIRKDFSTDDVQIILGEVREIRSNEISGKLEFSNDGVLFEEIGVGAGAGISAANSLANPTFDDGIENWTASNSTNFVHNTSTQGFGDGSAGWDATALSETVTSTPISLIENGLLENRCEAKVEYQTVATSTNWKLQAWDGSSVVAEKDLSIPTSTAVWTQDELRFDCPASGTLSLRVESSVADAALIKLDEMHLGKELPQPNSVEGPVSLRTRIVACRINNAGSAVIDTASGLCDWIETATRPGIGQLTIAVKPGVFSAPPVCSAIPVVPGVAQHCHFVLGGPSAVQVAVSCTNTAAALTDTDVGFICYGLQ